MGTLYLVATPIGNLEDISARALRLLGQVRLIAAEDTRRTRKLLEHYKINTLMISYFEGNKLTRLVEVLAALDQGDVALVSDAGTPALNDPGYELVQAVLHAGHMVSPIPGPSAPLAALVASGLPTDAFVYLGYLPRKGIDRRQRLIETAELPYTLVFLETPHRLMASLQDLLEVLGDRPVSIARELTKLHEEIYRGRISEALWYFTQHAPRGEFTLVVAGCEADKASWSEDELRIAIRKFRQDGAAAAKIAAELSKQSGWPRRKVYKLVMEAILEESNEPG